MSHYAGHIAGSTTASFLGGVMVNLHLLQSQINSVCMHVNTLREAALTLFSPKAVRSMGASPWPLDDLLPMRAADTDHDLTQLSLLLLCSRSTGRANNGNAFIVTII